MQALCLLEKFVELSIPRTLLRKLDTKKVTQVAPYLKVTEPF